MSAIVELKRVCPTLAVPLEQASESFTDNPTSALEQLDLWQQNLLHVLAAFEGMPEPKDGAASSRINQLLNRGLLPSQLQAFFHVLGNSGVTESLPASAIQKRSSLYLGIALRLADWFVKSYGPQLPKNLVGTNNIPEIAQYLQEHPPTDAVRRSTRQVAIRRAVSMQLSEDETRVIIDHQLRGAGWLADSWGLRHSLGTQPEKNANKAIAEWPTDSGPADYALFAGLEFVGVVEAKKWVRTFYPIWFRASATVAMQTWMAKGASPVAPRESIVSRFYSPPMQDLILIS